jgi:AraC-like DNA-binding protein
MESLFFQPGDKYFTRTALIADGRMQIERIDIAYGLTGFFLQNRKEKWAFDIPYKERMLVIVAAKHGDVICRVGKEENAIDIKEGEIVALSSGIDLFSLHALYGQRTETFVLCAADFYLKRYRSLRKNDPVDEVCRYVCRHENMVRIASLFYDEVARHHIDKLERIAENEPMVALKAEGTVNSLLQYILHALNPQTLPLSRKHSDIALRAQNILKERYASPPNIDTLAKMCSTNTYTLKRVFKNVFGDTIGSYVRKLRMERAAQLLLDGSCDIETVARRVGYRHSGHFAKRFFEYHGIYPSRYARMHSRL